MPDPFFSGKQPGQYWLQDLNTWYGDRSQPLPHPTEYGLLGEDRDKLRDQEMMDRILEALLGGPGGPGIDAYRSAVNQKKTPTPAPSPTPVDVIKTGAKTGYRTSNAEEKYRRLVGGN